ncbi:hypothetical protein RFI_18785 [Reticulomyxa filosa]|uniref:DEAD-box helicase OB fold domain-containing protein n=1 Tax=Reticulomyxa filosa TaxID=46433 RepID=X6MXE4_RETFI|nr:hypothetical protein RFI_18785 [Reticulomyxa filosa]|eukprot:ETO18479.1 hypothetical protein RFI_18785 [Reticulomyxa filosa]
MDLIVFVCWRKSFFSRVLFFFFQKVVLCMYICKCIIQRGDIKSVLHAIIRGYFSNAAQLQSNGLYKSIRGEQILEIHPSSILYSSGTPWVIYHEIIATTAQYMHDVSVVNPLWLQELASHFYMFKDLTHDREREFAKLQQKQQKQKQKSNK